MNRNKANLKMIFISANSFYLSEILHSNWLLVIISLYLSKKIYFIMFTSLLNNLSVSNEKVCGGCGCTCPCECKDCEECSTCGGDWIN